MDQKKNAHKEKYRQTNAKHWCTYCKIFIMNNDLAKKRHESSPQHQDAVKRFVGKIQKEERDKSRLLKDFASKTGMVLEATEGKQPKVQVQTSAPSFYSKPAEAKGVPVPLLSMRQPPVPRALALKKGTTSEPVGQVPVVQEKDNKVDKEKIMVESAIVGQWEAVADVPEPAREPSLVRTDKRDITETFKVTEKVIESLDDCEPVEFIKKSTVRRNIRK